jgi:hypothetical protein
VSEFFLQFYLNLRALGFVFTDFIEKELLDWVGNLLERWSSNAKVATSNLAHGSNARQ